MKIRSFAGRLISAGFLLFALPVFAVEQILMQTEAGTQYVKWEGGQLSGEPVVMVGKGDTGTTFNFLIIKNMTVDGVAIGNLITLPMEGLPIEEEVKGAFDAYSPLSVATKIQVYAKDDAPIKAKLSVVTQDPADNEVEILLGGYYFEYRTQNGGGSSAFGTSFESFR